MRQTVNRAVRQWIALLLCAATAVACARNPVTGERELSFISEEQEVALGRESAQQVVQQIGLVDDDALQDYVQRLGAQLAANSERPGLPWTFRVVDDPTPNAFALPGGFIFMTRGLLNLMNSEAELASVLGHEIAHVTAKHQVEQMSRAQLAQLGLALGTILRPDLEQLGQLAGTGLQLLFLKYGRDDERQADDLGFRYALEQGYDVREMPDVFAALARVGEQAGHSPLPSWLATHPYPEERIERVQQRLANLDQDLDRATLGTAEYLGQIDGLVYGENPRQGFFEGSTFYHPELGFRFSFPSGWQTQNLPQAVIGVSPQQDAIMQLTLAQGTPEQAAQQFAGQQGLQVLDATRTTVNGLPAAAVAFGAQTQQGNIRGLALFVAQGNTTYQFLAYTPAQRYQQYDRILQQSLASFGEVTDQRILNVQPNRVDVVRLPREMTLAQFAQTYPSVIPIEQLALINQVAGAESVMPAATLVKRVVPSGAAR